MNRRRRRTLVASALGVVLSIATAHGSTVSCPPDGRPRFRLEVPDGWRSRFIGGSEHRVEIMAPHEGVKIEAWTLPANAQLDDVVAQSVDGTLSKAVFSNLHQRRQLNGIPVIAFIGSGRDRKQARAVRFEFYSFALDDHEAGMLRIDVPAGAASSTREAATAVAESLTIVDR